MTATTTRTAAVTTDVFGTMLTLNFSNGKELIVDTTKLSAEIILQATMHGLKQKLVDAAAIGRDMVTGKTATIDDKYNAVLSVYERITMEGGTWNANREGVEKAQGGMFVRAMMELTKKDKTAIDAQIATLSKEQIAALKKNPRIMDIMHRLEREKTTGNDTSNALLEALMNGVVETKPMSATIGDSREFIRN